MSKPKQRTLKESGEMEGVGLHSGVSVRLRLTPAAPSTGIRFRRTDLEGTPEIPAHVDAVVGFDRGTTLGAGEGRVQTVEHVLSALAGLGIDNAVVELDAAEPPAGDGSSRAFAELIDGLGFEEQPAEAKVLEVRDGFALDDGESRYVASRAAAYEISAEIDFRHPLIGRQSVSVPVTPESYRSEVASARTFGFLHEVEALRARGLARGGTPENALVLTEQGLYEGTELRFPDEFARHKVLDMVGDLALAGTRIRGRFAAERPSHRGNISLAKRLAKMSEQNGAGQPVMDIQQILQKLPHRYPLLLVDRVLEFESRKRIVGLKNVTINEPFFVGHFPGHPIMPGVLIVEAMAQVGGLLLMEAIDDPENKLVYFMSVDKVKWRRPVTPGDQLRFEVEVLQIRGTTARMKGVGTVDGQVVAEAEMMARVVDK